MEAPADGFLYMADYKRSVGGKILKGHKKFLWKGKEGVLMGYRTIPKPEPPNMYLIRRTETQGVETKTLVGIEQNNGSDEETGGGSGSGGPPPPSSTALTFEALRANITGKDYIRTLAAAGLGVAAAPCAAAAVSGATADSDEEVLVAAEPPGSYLCIVVATCSSDVRCPLAVSALCRHLQCIV
jgi:hypothetical protein